MPHGIKLELTSEQQDLVIQWVFDGRSYVNICKALGCDPLTLLNYRYRNPEFNKRIQESRAARTEDFVDTLQTVSDSCNTMEEIAAARLKSDNIKWTASKLIPQTYGDNINLNVNHNIDLSSVLLAAANRVKPILEMKQALAPREIPRVLEVESSRDRAALGLVESEVNTTDSVSVDIVDLIKKPGGSFEDLL